MQPRTRNEMIKDAEARVFSAVNNLLSITAPEDWADTNKLAEREIRQHDTTSDAWYDLIEDTTQERAKPAIFKVAQAVLVRNGYHDGLPFCPLCGKLGQPEHNGAPLIEAQVCEACNYKKVIPARIRAAQKEEAKW